MSRSNTFGKQSQQTSSQVHKALVVKKFVELISLDVDLDRTRQLLLPHKGITELPTQLGSLLSQVRRLDLSFNNLTDLSPLSSLMHLTNLNVSHNPYLASLSSLNCSHLLVLTAAHCNLADITGITKCKTTLRTLVANDNNICLSPTHTTTRKETISNCNKHNGKEIYQSIAIAKANYDAIASLEVIETIILSRNEALCKFAEDIEETEKTLGEKGHNGNITNGKETKRSDDDTTTAKAHPLSVFAQLLQLRKLSLSNCSIRSLPQQWYLPKLNELRLAHNSLETLQPDGVLLQSLKILDIAHNQFYSIATLRRCKYLQQLSLTGNTVYDVYAARDKTVNVDLLLQNIQSSITSNETTTTTKTKTTMSIKKDAAAVDKPRVPLTLQRALRKMFLHLTLIDGQPLLPESMLEQIPASVKHWRVKRDREETQIASSEEEEQRQLYKEELVENNSNNNSNNNKNMKLREKNNSNEHLEEEENKKTVSIAANTELQDNHTSMTELSHDDEEEQEGEGKKDNVDVSGEREHNKQDELLHMTQNAYVMEENSININHIQKSVHDKCTSEKQQEEQRRENISFNGNHDAHITQKNTNKEHNTTFCNKTHTNNINNDNNDDDDNNSESDVVFTPALNELNATMTHAPIIRRTRVYDIHDNNTLNINNDKSNKSNNNIHNANNRGKNRKANNKVKGNKAHKTDKEHFIVTHGCDAVNAFLQNKSVNNKW